MSKKIDISSNKTNRQTRKKIRLKSLWYFFIHKSKNLFQQIDFKMAIKVAITAILSFYLCVEVDQYLKHPADLTAGLWCVLASIVVLQNNIGGTYRAIWNRFLGVFIGSIVGAFFAFGFGAEIETMGVAIFLTVILCSLLGIQDSYRIASLSVAIIMIPWKLHPTGDPWIYAFFRFLDTCLGFTVAIAVSHLIWPSQSLIKMRLNMAETFVLFRQLFGYVLTSHPGLHKSDKILCALLKDIEQTFNQSRTVLEESKVELLLQFFPLDIWVNLLTCQERLGENLRAIQEVFNVNLEEIFDQKLKQQLQLVVETIDFTLKELSFKLKTGQTNFDFSILSKSQSSLTQELIRFRSTHTIKRYHLEAVEKYYVFFYQIKQILMTLQTFNQVYDQSKS